MLAANETIAEDFYWRQLPFVYRNHEEPDMEKVSQLTTFYKQLWIFCKNVKRADSSKGTSEIIKEY